MALGPQYRLRCRVTSHVHYVQGPTGFTWMSEDTQYRPFKKILKGEVRRHVATLVGIDPCTANVPTFFKCSIDGAIMQSVIG